MSVAETEKAMLEIVQAEMAAEGYTVILLPSSDALPPELRDLQPDAIALKGSEKILIEVRAPGKSRATDTKQLTEKANAAGWDYRLFIANVRPNDDVRTAPRSEILAFLDSIETHVSLGQLSAALLLSWATFEAIARSVLPSTFMKPQTPGRIVEVLANKGVLMPDEAQKVRSLIAARNSTIHGDLLMRASANDVTAFVGIMRSLLDRQPVPAE
jgi:uncharacterized protein YutE (UPF0331/DUF86 family)